MDESRNHGKFILSLKITVFGFQQICIYTHRKPGQYTEKLWFFGGFFRSLRVRVTLKLHSSFNILYLSFSLAKFSWDENKGK